MTTNEKDVEVKADEQKNGNIKVKRKNKNLDRPRTEGHRIAMMSSCVSVGMPSSGGDSGKGMAFQAKPRPASELWGSATKDRRPSANR